MDNQKKPIELTPEVIKEIIYKIEKPRDYNPDFSAKNHEEMLAEAKREGEESLKTGDMNLVVPISDEKGNLLWPKEMSKEELEKFLSER